MKYINTEVTFLEVPDEISLCINISSCKYHCKGCHSPWLWEDKGKELTIEELHNLIVSNPGISCVCFMGGDDITDLAYYVQKHNLKVAWYTGGTEFPKDIKPYDYIKIGPYVEELGGLDKTTTNQRLYKVINNDFFEDITYKFHKKL